MTDKKPPTAEAISNGETHAAPTSIAQQYDLLPKLIPNLDRHLTFPLLEFLSGLDGDESSEVLKAKYELLKQTNMTDYVASLWQEINDSDDVPEEFLKKREEVLQRLSLFTEETKQIDELLNDESVVSNLRSDKVANLKFLEQQHGVTIQMVDMLYDYGRFQYSCGSYANAAHLLDQFRILSTDNDKASSASWGKLAADILTTNWEIVMEEVNKVKESIDTKLFNNPLAQLEHRTWLIHWTLFPFFNYEPARDTITEMLFSPSFINTIQTNCPWILRYLAAAVITNRSRTRNTGAYQKQLKDLVRVVRQEGYEYNDPVTEFIKALYVDFDFEEAQKKLGEAEEVLKGDFFLSATADAFVEAARHLISESYCKIHQRIDIKYAPFSDLPSPPPPSSFSISRQFPTTPREKDPPHTDDYLFSRTQGSLRPTRLEPRRRREMDRQSDPGYPHGRQIGLQGRYRSDEPSGQFRLSAGALFCPQSLPSFLFFSLSSTRPRQLTRARVGDTGHRAYQGQFLPYFGP